jgi:hypothetical protein
MVSREHREEGRLVNRVDFYDASSRVADIRARDDVVVQQHQNASASAEEGVDGLVRYQFAIYVYADCLEDTRVLVVGVGSLRVETRLERFSLAQEYPEYWPSSVATLCGLANRGRRTRRTERS